MAYIICKLVNDLLVPVDIRRLGAVEATAELDRLRDAEPLEHFVALAVL